MLGRRTRIEIKDAEQLAHMRAAGLVVAGALDATRAAVAPGVSTAQLDAVAAQYIADAGARSNFKGYHGFPGVICTSVNDEVVHGIPGTRVLREGDLISIDCGAIVHGWHGDAAITVAVGGVSDELAELSAATERALWAGIARALVGGRLSDIGAAASRRWVVATASCATTSGTGSARPCTWSPRWPTSGHPGGGRCCARGWPWPSSRWSPSGPTR